MRSRPLSIRILVALLLAGGPASRLDAQAWFTFERLAGPEGGPGVSDGAGGAARLRAPVAVAADAAGALYVTDASGPSVRRITPGGTVTTLAGRDGAFGSSDGLGADARFEAPRGVAVDAAGSVVVVDRDAHAVMKASPLGSVLAFAGLPGGGGAADGAGSAARFALPAGAAADGSGNVYVADRGNHTIRKLTAGGLVTTLAGLAGAPGDADGLGTDARFRFPAAVALDGAGNVYVADGGNHTIRRVTPAGVVGTLAGLAGVSGSADGSGAAARFSSPSGIAADASGRLFVADTGNDTVRAVNGVTVTTLAGVAGEPGAEDGIGPAARFDLPTALALAPSGDLYVADSGNFAVRRLTAAGEVSTVAGLASPLGAADGAGAAARFEFPAGLAADAAGNVYLADIDGHTVRKITPAGVVSTLAGLAGVSGAEDGSGSGARFSSPESVCVDAAGIVYVADTGNHLIRRVTATGVTTTLAGLAGVAGADDGSGSAARFRSPSGIAADAAGVVYVADGGNHTVRRVTPGGLVTTLAGLAGRSGSMDGIGSSAGFSSPVDLATDAAGNVYVADTGNATVRKVIPAGVVTTLAGLAGSRDIVDGSGSAARFDRPVDLAVDASGNVLVAESDAHVIRSVTPAGLVTTVAGRPFEEGSEDATGVFARFRSPVGIATDAAGRVYVSDWASIRIGRPALPDRATIDAASGPVGMPRQLDGLPRTASAWSWRLVRAPSGSAATLSAPDVPDPTFTPDVADLFRFELTAIGAGATSVSVVELDTRCTPGAIVSPAGAGLCAGAPLSLSVSAAGATGYQWTRDAAILPGATSATYAVAAATPADSGVYRCELGNACGTVQSDPALVEVDAGLPGEVAAPLVATKQGSLVRFEWSGRPDARTYGVFLDTDPAGAFSLRVATTAATVAFAAPPAGSAYYRVAAANWCGTGSK